MLPNTNRWIFALTATILIVFFGVLSQPAQVSAAQGMEPSANSCLACHEDLYYLHDTGKLYCITDHTDRCVNCHEGDAAVMKKEEAHLGLIVHPQENRGEKCQECHTAQVAQERLAKFASEGGFNTVIKADAYTSATQVSVGFPDVQGANSLLEKIPWLTGAFILFGVWLVLVLFSPLKP